MTLFELHISTELLMMTVIMFTFFITIMLVLGIKLSKAFRKYLAATIFWVIIQAGFSILIQQKFSHTVEEQFFAMIIFGVFGYIIVTLLIRVLFGVERSSAPIPER